jgi:ArsR family transcriptional regulator
MDANQFQRIAKALADPRRLEILEIISASSEGQDLCCGAVVDKFPVAQATISHHLRELADAGLIETRAEGQFKRLRARPEVLSEYMGELARRMRLKTAPVATATETAGKE